MRKTSSDISVTRFSIAVDRPFKSGEEKQADFISLVAWRQTAEFITRYFTKGQRIGVEGSLRMNKFTDKDGNNRTSYEVVINNAHFVENKRDNDLLFGIFGGETLYPRQSAPIHSLSVGSRRV